MAIVGYARVSTRDQDLAGQFAELKAAGCELVYREKVSSAASDRKELARLVRKLERGDTVIVMRLDRLARSTRDLLNILDEIGKAGAGFRSIKDTWADTTTSHGRLMLTILGGLAEFERELIKDRTDAGRVRAKARGVKFGRKPKLNPFQREQALARLSSGETQAEVARTYGVDRATISRLASPLPFERAPRFPETEGPTSMTVPRHRGSVSVTRLHSSAAPIAAGMRRAAGPVVVISSTASTSISDCASGVTTRDIIVYCWAASNFSSVGPASSFRGRIESTGMSSKLSK